MVLKALKVTCGLIYESNVIATFKILKSLPFGVTMKEIHTRK